MGKRKGNLAIVEDDMVEDEDDFELDDEDEDEEDDLLEEDEGDEEEETVAPPKPVRKGSKRTPPIATAEEEDDDDEDEEDFEQVLSAPNTPSRTPVLRDLSDDALVIELTELLMQGDDSEMTTVLVPMFTGPRGPKIAKKLVREARDRAVAKLKRVADVCCVNIDTFSDDD